MDDNIYYYPEKFNLAIVAEIDTGGDYEFDKLVVFKNEQGKLFFDTDSGCSCPDPFENKSIGDLKEITDIEEFERFVRNEWKNQFRSISVAEIRSFIEQVSEAFVTP